MNWRDRKQAVALRHARKKSRQHHRPKLRKGHAAHSKKFDEQLDLGMGLLFGLFGKLGGKS